MCDFVEDVSSEITTFGPPRRSFTDAKSCIFGILHAPCVLFLFYSSMVMQVIPTWQSFGSLLEASEAPPPSTFCVFSSFLAASGRFIANDSVGRTFLEHKWTEIRPFGKSSRVPKAAFGASADGAIWVIPFYVSWRSGAMSRSAEATACVR